MNSIPDYTPHKDDYSTKTPSGIHLCSIRGGRDHQQDALSVCDCYEALDTFRSLPDLYKAKALDTTVNRLQENHASKRYYGGTTLCSAVTWQDEDNLAHAWISNVGDSMAFFVVTDTNSQVKYAKRINALHNVNPRKNSSEYARVSKYKPLLDDNYLENPSGTSGLAVTRSIGDRIFETRGLSHTPDIYHVQRQLEQGESAFVVLACDGVENLLHPRSITRIFTNCMTAENIAFELVRKARPKSSDNISVAFVPMGQSAIVADGHGLEGELVAKNIAEKFFPTLAAAQFEVGPTPILDQMLLVLEHHYQQRFATYKNVTKAKTKSIDFDDLFNASNTSNNQAPGITLYSYLYVFLASRNNRGR